MIHHIEPKICFRGVRGYDNLVDIGANIALWQEYLNISAIYHSSRNFTMGVGFNYHFIGLHALYTTQTGGLQHYSNGSFELGLSLHVFK